MTKNDLILSNYEGITKYLQSIKKIPPLSKEEEVELILKIRGGDNWALSKLIRSNLRFVVGVAKKFRGLGLPFEDLISFGNIGLLSAVEKFDEERGFKFISFAVWFIKAEIKKALKELPDVIRIPNNREKTFTYQDLDDKDVIIEDDHNFNKSDLILELDSILSSLSETELDMITRFYGFKRNFPQSVSDIAKEWNMSSENVRLIIRKAEAKLKQHPRVELLRPFLA